jgi:hypothetical protein
MRIIVRLFIKYNVNNIEKNTQHNAICYINTIQLSHYSSTNVHYITQHKC